LPRAAWPDVTGIVFTRLTCEMMFAGFWTARPSGITVRWSIPAMSKPMTLPRMACSSGGPDQREPADIGRRQVRLCVPRRARHGQARYGAVWPENPTREISWGFSLNGVCVVIAAADGCEPAGARVDRRTNNRNNLGHSRRHRRRHNLRHSRRRKRRHNLRHNRRHSRHRRSTVAEAEEHRLGSRVEAAEHRLGSRAEAAEHRLDSKAGAAERYTRRDHGERVRGGPLLPPW
jgi:hypothetical protein